MQQSPVSIGRRAILGGLVAMSLALSGCAVLGKEAVQVIMQIAENVLVTQGSKYLDKLLGGDSDTDRPTVSITYADNARQQNTVTYAVDKAKAISVSGVQGSVEISGDGKKTDVRVQPQSTATIEINGTDHPSSTTNPPSPQPVVPGPPDAAPAPDTGRADAAKILSGTWQGRYRCSQGLTGLRLVLYPTDDGVLLGTFSFFAVSSNPRVPSGQSAMRGSYSEASWSLAPDYWIDHPAGYFMIDMAGQVPITSSAHLTGRLGGGCKTFDLTKTSTKTHKPPL
jgi:hypothetical protein